MEKEILNYEIERHWRLVWGDNKEGVGDEKSILHTKMSDVYMNNKI